MRTPKTDDELMFETYMRENHFEIWMGWLVSKMLTFQPTPPTFKE